MLLVNLINPSPYKEGKNMKIVVPGIVSALLIMLLAGCSTTANTVDLEAKISTAQQTADEAKAIATRAERKADEAITTANNAMNASENANTKAERALNAANEAKNMAQDSANRAERMFERSISK